jgi:GNAT superfamily N-acetyltransferase
MSESSTVMSLGRDDVRLRVAEASDEPVLQSLYASSRQRELLLTNFSDAEKAAFCEMQYRAQRTHYRNFYPSAVYWLIERVRGSSGEVCEPHVIGRLYWARLQSEREDVLMEMTLVPEERKSGLGTAVVSKILEWAARDGRSVSLHVEIGNPSVHLCERLGFQRVGEGGLVQKLVWSPTTST